VADHANIWRITAYGLAGIPAAIGTAFVARYAYVTSDTAIDGASNGFLFGLIAAGAFAGPACAIAVGHRGRKTAAAVLGILAVLAMLTNWSHTLGAVAHRGAGTEATTLKAKADEKDARTELARVAAERKAMAFTSATAETVEAARAAVAAAERTRRAECGDGDPKKRGLKCEAREKDEATARATLVTATADKAATDQAAKLDTAAATIRAKLQDMKPAKETNSLGEALGRLLPWLSAATAATFQQGLVSAIAELLIAAALALPELLQRKQPAESGREPEAEIEPQQLAKRPPMIAGVSLIEPPKPVTPSGTDTVGRFMLACLSKAPGDEVAGGAIFARYRRWCSEQTPQHAALETKAFAQQFAERCERLGIRMRRDGSKVYCVGVQLVA
jgi:hypothetical protein